MSNKVSVAALKDRRADKDDVDVPRKDAVVVVVEEEEDDKVHNPRDDRGAAAPRRNATERAARERLESMAEDLMIALVFCLFSQNNKRR